MASADGFILTEWGEWTASKVMPAVERALSLGARQLTLLVELTQAASPDAPARWSFADAGSRLEAGAQGARLREVSRQVRDAGASVGLIPLLHWDGGGRQWLRPREPERWLERYAGGMRELAAFATSIDARELVVGSELTRLFPYSTSWRGVIGPKGLSSEKVKYWESIFAQLVKSEEWKQHIAQNARTNEFMGSEDTKRYYEAQYRELHALLITAGLAR